MKTRSKCKMCGATGIITSAINGGHFQHYEWKDYKTENGEEAKKWIKTIDINNGQSAKCPYCKPDKYPKQEKEQ